jgi:hypothetical protein
LLLELQLRQFQLGVIRNFVFINIDLGLPLVHGLDVFLGNAMTMPKGSCRLLFSGMFRRRSWLVVHSREDLLDDVIDMAGIPGMGQDELGKGVSAGLSRPGKAMPALFVRELKPGCIKDVLQPDKRLRAANTGTWLHVASIGTCR